MSILLALYSEYVVLPGPYTKTSSKILDDPKFRPFRHCIGAIDGSHIPAKVKESIQSRWRNRKGYISQNILAACDFDMEFVYVCAGWEGSAHDGRVYQFAINNDFIIPDGKYYLADAGYGLKRGLLTPYRGIRYHLKEQGRASQR